MKPKSFFFFLHFIHAFVVYTHCGKFARYPEAKGVRTFYLIFKHNHGEAYEHLSDVPAQPFCNVTIMS